MEETQHQGHREKELLPRLPRRMPAIRAVRVGLIGQRKRMSFLRELAIARLQRRRIGGGDHTHPQETAHADGGRDVDLLACHPGHLLIGHQISGHVLRVFDRGPRSEGRQRNAIHADERSVRRYL